MKVLKIAVISLCILVVLAVVVGVFLPSKVHVERATTIDSPPATVFALVNGFALYNRWSPWFKMDPEARYTFEGPAFGPGAKMSWVSDNQWVGTGSREITVAVPFEHVEVHMDFGEEGTAETAFDIEKVEGGTRIAWSFDTDFGWNLLGRYQGLFFDSWIGDKYEEGLDGLKEYAETLPNFDWSTMDFSVVELKAVPILYVHGETEATDAASIGQTFEAAYGTIATLMRRMGLKQAGAPLVFARPGGKKGFAFDAGIPYAGDITEAELETSSVQRGTTPPGRTIQAVHVGSYVGISESYLKVMAFMGAHGFQPSGDPWESYVSDPTVTPQDKMLTIISYPVDDPVFE